MKVVTTKMFMLCLLLVVGLAWQTTALEPCPDLDVRKCRERRLANGDCLWRTGEECVRRDRRCAGLDIKACLNTGGCEQRFPDDDTSCFRSQLDQGEQDALGNLLASNAEDLEDDAVIDQDLNALFEQVRDIVRFYEAPIPTDREILQFFFGTNATSDVDDSNEELSNDCQAELSSIVNGILNILVLFATAGKETSVSSSLAQAFADELLATPSLSRVIVKQILQTGKLGESGLAQLSGAFGAVVDALQSIGLNGLLNIARETLQPAEDDETVGQIAIELAAVFAGPTGWFSRLTTMAEYLNELRILGNTYDKAVEFCGDEDPCSVENASTSILSDESQRSNPYECEGYSVTTTFACPRTAITIQVRGSDGYEDEITCVSSPCRLNVPTALAGVEDSIEVWTKTGDLDPQTLTNNLLVFQDDPSRTRECTACRVEGFVYSEETNDCTSCGNGACDLEETAFTCPEDCTSCGNGVCDLDETVSSCPEDCCVGGDCGLGSCLGKKPCSDGSCVPLGYCCPDERYCDVFQVPRPPRPRGDPVISQFGGRAYECNAAGEFVLLKSTSSGFQLQGRFEAVEGASASASVVTALVIRDVGPTIEISLHEKMDGSCEDSRILVDGVGVSASTQDLEDGFTLENGDITIQLDPPSDGVRTGSVTYNDHSLRLDVVIASTPSFGCYFLSHSVQFPIAYGGTITPRPGYRFEESICGLLGSPYSVNTFFDADCSVIAVNSASPGSAYAYCTSTFCIRDETESLFSYQDGQSFEDYQNCDAPFVAIDTSQCPPEGVNLCGSNNACLLDCAVGGIEAARLNLEDQRQEANESKLTANDGAVFDSFGISVAISGDTAVVGAYQDAFNSGSAYIYDRQSDGSWNQVAKLTASDGASTDRFGISVAISGDTAVVGAYRDDDNGVDSGSAYIFDRRSDGNWNQVAKLTASDGAEGDVFGISVAISGDTAVVGADRDDDNGFDSGSAYIFDRQSDGSWNQVAKLTASDGAGGDVFGFSVAISGDTAVVGAYFDDVNGLNDGSAYIFDRQSDGSWNQVAKLTASDGARTDYLGYSVAISGDTAVVGAYLDDVNGLNDGSAYIFDRQSDGSWNQVAKLTASDGAGGDRFGYSVAISGDTAVVGTHRDDDNGLDSGSAFIYDRQPDGSWNQVAKLTASDGAGGDWFGISVAISGDTAVVGADRDDDNGFASGSAYIYELGS